MRQEFFDDLLVPGAENGLLIVIYAKTPKLAVILIEEYFFDGFAFMRFCHDLKDDLSVVTSCSFANEPSSKQANEQTMSLRFECFDLAQGNHFEYNFSGKQNNLIT